MATDAKQEETPNPPEAAKTAEVQPGQDKSNAPPEAESGRSRLGKILHLAMLGFAPLIAIIALVVAGFAVSANRVSQAQLSSATSQLKSLNAALTTSNTELANIKKIVANLGARQENGLKKQEVLTQQVVQSVSKLQVKAKIKPTLEDQLQQPASSPAATPPAATPPAATPPAATPPAASTKTNTRPVATEAPKKGTPQVQAIKDAIEAFNKNDSRKR